jgi:hypothetical protein
MGQGETYAEKKRRKVQCYECTKTLAQSSLSNHLIRQHGTHLRVLELSNNITDKGPPRLYQVSFPEHCRVKLYPSEDCSGKATPRANLRRHFMFKHPQDDIIILEEGFIPRCKKCDMFVPKTAKKHTRPRLCKQRA